MKPRSTSAQRRRKIIDIKKQGGGACAFCGYDKNFAALDFHHVDPTQKEFSVNSAMKETSAQVAREIEKCVLLCRNCHQELHYPEMAKEKWLVEPTVEVKVTAKPVINPEKVVKLPLAPRLTEVDWWKLAELWAPLAVEEMSQPDYIRPPWLSEKDHRYFIGLDTRTQS